MELRGLLVSQYTAYTQPNFLVQYAQSIYSRLNVLVSIHLRHIT